MLELIKIISALCFLAIGSILDIKKREVEDWLNYGFIFFSFFINAVLAIIANDYWIIIYSVAGFFLAYLISVLLFYTNQWGGGDAKVLMGIGALVGIKFNFSAIIKLDFVHIFSGNIFIVQFLINLFIVGGIVAIVWSFYVSLKNKKNKDKLSVSIMDMYHKTKLYRFFLWGLSAVFLVFGFVTSTTGLKIMSITSAFIIFLMYYLYVFIKSFEAELMIKEIDPKKVTEGDWIVEDVYVKKEYVCGPKDYGISKKQIARLVKLYDEGKIKSVKIKEGMPFVPSFFLAFILTIAIPSWAFLLGYLM